MVGVDEAVIGLSALMRAKLDVEVDWLEARLLTRRNMLLITTFSPLNSRRIFGMTINQFEIVDNEVAMTIHKND
jgi:hypothetical protein